jgi:membrane-associated protease RseP (regulator of RpoE activity)
LGEAQAAFRRYERPAAAPWRLWVVHVGLLLVTIFTTTLAGVQLTGVRDPLGFLPLELFKYPAPLLRTELLRGLWFALPFLGVLTVHEFGHYFVARYHRVRTTLPYYIPFPLGLGTFGAVIRIKGKIFSRKEFFDIGIAGPLAGLLAAVPLLIYGFTHLPPLDYLFSLHPDYAQYGADYARHVYNPNGTGGFVLTQPLLYQWLEHAFADPARLPHPNELLHYPVLVAGLMSLFFTALNLLPLGQFDGGHILYSLLGFRRYNRLVPLLFIGFIFYAGLGLFSLHDGWQTWLYGGLPYALYLTAVFWRMLPTGRQALLLGAAVWAAQLACVAAWPTLTGNPGWLVIGLVLGQFIGVYHPEAPDERPLSVGRQALGWLMVVIFVLCFTPSPFRLG